MLISMVKLISFTKIHLLILVSKIFKLNEMEKIMNAALVL